MIGHYSDDRYKGSRKAAVDVDLCQPYGNANMQGKANLQGRPGDWRKRFGESEAAERASSRPSSGWNGQNTLQTDLDHRIASMLLTKDSVGVRDPPQDSSVNAAAASAPNAVVAHRAAVAGRRRLQAQEEDVWKSCSAAAATRTYPSNQPSSRRTTQSLGEDPWQTSSGAANRQAHLASSRSNGPWKTRSAATHIKAEVGAASRNRGSSPTRAPRPWQVQTTARGRKAVVSDGRHTEQAAGKIEEVDLVLQRSELDELRAQIAQLETLASEHRSQQNTSRRDGRAGNQGPSSHYHQQGGTQNQGNVLGSRSCVRQSKLFRQYESGNSMKGLLGWVP